MFSAVMLSVVAPNTINSLLGKISPLLTSLAALKYGSAQPFSLATLPQQQVYLPFRGMDNFHLELFFW
jgi:hypothetical protein